MEKDDPSVDLGIRESKVVYILGKTPSLRVNNSPLLIVLHFSPLLSFRFIYNITYRVSEFTSSPLVGSVVVRWKSSFRGLL